MLPKKPRGLTSETTPTWQRYEKTSKEYSNRLVNTKAPLMKTANRPQKPWTNTSLRRTKRRTQSDSAKGAGAVNPGPRVYESWARRWGFAWSSTLRARAPLYSSIFRWFRPYALTIRQPFLLSLNQERQSRIPKP